MKCGQAILVKDFYGAYAARFIAQCEGRFLMITNGLEPRNGYLLADWRGVLRELLAMVKPRALVEHTRTVEATSPDGLYVGFGLVWPLSSATFAELFGVSADDVRGELADLAVPYEM